MKILSFPEYAKQGKYDPISVGIVISIYAFMIFAAVFILSWAGVLALIVGGGIVAYQMLAPRPKNLFYSYGHKNRLSLLSIILLAMPFVMGAVVAFDQYAVHEKPFRATLLWAMVVTFWIDLLFGPASTISKFREEQLPFPRSYPSMSVLVPAYNEEKVIARTIESLLVTDYPGKLEIIVIDDGSKDSTLQIAKRFEKKGIKILSKKNGGKATALNYGFTMSKGEIIVIVDADTIMGRHSLKQIMKGFHTRPNVQAVAGNIRIRNPQNWISRCQSLEYISGIQVVRRSFDLHGAITIIPGALGAITRRAVNSVGAYHSDTIVEDFDITIKCLKNGPIAQGHSEAVAYTECPITVGDFNKQRKRWARGNIQVIRRHSDCLTNSRYGFLQRLAFPYLIIGMFIMPAIGFIAIGNAVAVSLMGSGFWVLQIALVFFTLHMLLTWLAIRIDDGDMKLMWYAPLLVFGFKQISDFILIKAIFDEIRGTKATWTSAARVGV